MSETFQLLDNLSGSAI